MDDGATLLLIACKSGHTEIAEAARSERRGGLPRAGGGRITRFASPP